MRNTIGIRRETVDATERRAPLTPDQVRRIVSNLRIGVIVEPSPLRVYPDSDYENAGATISDDLSPCNIVFGVKEVPTADIAPDGTYCFFSHTIKAQRYNMPMLRHIIDVGATLLDYELVKNDLGKRVVAFGEYAGYAGMIDSLWALGARLDWEGIPNPFSKLRPTREYETLEAAEAVVGEVGQQIRVEGLPDAITPFVTVFTGAGHVFQGARRIFNLLPSVKVLPEDLPTLSASHYAKNAVYGCVFDIPDLYKPLSPERNATKADFKENPREYTSTLHSYIDYMTVLINGTYWSPRHPRLLTRELMKQRYAAGEKPPLRVVGDITCDIQGSIEFTVKATTSESPVYVYNPSDDTVVDGFEGEGPVVLAVDKLPSELPRESTHAFGEALLPYIPALATADFSKPLEHLDLPEPFKRAVIAHKGRLTDHFRYLNEFILHAD